MNTSIGLQFSKRNTDIGVRMAIAVIAVIPVLIIYPFFQKFLSVVLLSVVLKDEYYKSFYIVTKFKTSGGKRNEEGYFNFIGHCNDDFAGRMRKLRYRSNR